MLLLGLERINPGGNMSIQADFPLVFVKGSPASLNSLNEKQLGRFLQYLWEYTHVERSTRILPGEPVKKADRIKLLRRAIENIYDRQGCLYLLHLSEGLANCHKNSIHIETTHDACVNVWDKGYKKVIAKLPKSNLEYDKDLYQNNNNRGVMSNTIMTKQAEPSQFPGPSYILLQNKLIKKVVPKSIICTNKKPFASIKPLNVSGDANKQRDTLAPQTKKQVVSASPEKFPLPKIQGVITIEDEDKYADVYEISDEEETTDDKDPLQISELPYCGTVEEGEGGSDVEFIEDVPKTTDEPVSATFEEGSDVEFIEDVPKKSDIEAVEKEPESEVRTISNIPHYYANRSARHNDEDSDNSDVEIVGISHLSEEPNVPVNRGVLENRQNTIVHVRKRPVKRLLKESSEVSAKKRVPGNQGESNAPINKSPQNRLETNMHVIDNVIEEPDPGDIRNILGKSCEEQSGIVCNKVLLEDTVIVLDSDSDEASNNNADTNTIEITDVSSIIHDGICSVNIPPDYNEVYDEKERTIYPSESTSPPIEKTDYMHYFGLSEPSNLPDDPIILPEINKSDFSKFSKFSCTLMPFLAKNGLVDKSVLTPGPPGQNSSAHLSTDPYILEMNINPPRISKSAARFKSSDVLRARDYKFPKRTYRTRPPVPRPRRRRLITPEINRTSTSSEQIPNLRRRRPTLPERNRPSTSSAQTPNYFTCDAFKGYNFNCKVKLQRLNPAVIRYFTNLAR